MKRKAATSWQVRKDRLKWLVRHAVWNIGIVDAPIATFLMPGARPPVRWLPEPRRGTYLADPFMVETGHDDVILAEGFDYAGRRGYIAALASTSGHEFGPPVPVIREPFHLSYPYVIQHEGRIYCVPESADVRQVCLYEAIGFPYAWERRVTLIEDFAALDASIFQHDGAWWLFCSEKDDPRGDTLHAWHAPDLFGPWRPHAANPIKRDLGSARPAGAPFVQEGQLYRPGQDSTSTYGGAVVVHRVLRLTQDEFAEEPVSRVEPYANGRYRYGLHTLTACGSRTLVDGKRYGFIPREFRYRLRRSLPFLKRS